jgi:hypothetical protein
VANRPGMHMRRASVNWAAPRTIVLLAAIVLFVLAGIDVGDKQDLIAWGLAVFAAAFIL